MEYVDSRSSDCDSSWKTLSREMVKWEKMGLLPKKPSTKLNKEKIPVKLICRCPGVCVKWFVGMTAGKQAQIRFGGTLRAFIDGKWQDVKE
jgi:hypothetical protein